MVATLTRIFGLEHLTLAEDVVQATLARRCKPGPSMASRKIRPLGLCGRHAMRRWMWSGGKKFSAASHQAAWRATPASSGWHGRRSARSGDAPACIISWLKAAVASLIRVT
jgi:hypothetical protein